MTLLPPTLVPWLFRGASALLALPSAAALVAWLFDRARGAPAPPRSVVEGVERPDGVLLVLEGLQRTLGGLFGGLGALGLHALTGLDVLGACGLVVAAGPPRAVAVALALATLVVAQAVWSR